MSVPSGPDMRYTQDGEDPYSQVVFSLDFDLTSLQIDYA
jgi:hypothetical protein